MLPRHKWLGSISFRHSCREVVLNQAPSAASPDPYQQLLALRSRPLSLAGDPVISLDLRSLACLRIGLAVVLLIDIAQRLPHATAHYSDAGVLPRTALMSVVPETPQRLCFQLINGSTPCQWMWFGLQAVAAVALLMGYKTRLATFFSWLLLISLHTRNPLVLQGGDTVLRMLLFWGMFLPLGACFAWDRRGTIAQSAAMPSVSTASRHFVSCATAGLIIQISFIYWFSALAKTDPAWQRDGTAIYLALQLSFFAKPAGQWLLQFPLILKYLTFGTLILEMAGPCFLFLPYLMGPVRTALVVLFVVFHLCLGITLSLGLFPLVCIVAWLALTPGWAWEKFARWKVFQRCGWFRMELTPIDNPTAPVEIRHHPATVSVSAPLARTLTLLSNGLACFFIVAIFLINIRAINRQRFASVVPPAVQWIANVTRVDQSWGLFAPQPPRDDGWFSMPATLRDGSRVDLLRGGPPARWDLVADVPASYQGTRWRRYFMNLLKPENDRCLTFFGEYVSRRWNRVHFQGQQVAEYQIIFTRRRTMPPGQTSTPEKIVLLDSPVIKNQ